MNCRAVMKSGAPCPSTAVSDGYCRVHYNLVFKLENRVRRLEIQLAEEKARLAELKREMWPGNPS